MAKTAYVIDLWTLDAMSKVIIQIYFMLLIILK